MKAPFVVGELVHDDLTRHKCKVIGISYGYGKVWEGGKQVHYGVGAWGIWLDDPYLDGGRHPWEVSKIRNTCQTELDFKDKFVVTGIKGIALPREEESARN